MTAALLLAAAVATPHTVVVTTSMLAAAVHEVAPGSAVQTTTLLPPASCPGHFDLDGRALERLRGADLILRHGFEGALEERLRAAGVPAARVVVAPGDGALTVPDNFSRLLQRLADDLGTRFPSLSGTLRGRAERARSRVDTVGEEVRRRSRGLAGTPVVASAMQAELCRYLGLEVIATIPRPEDTTPRDLERLMARRPRFVVANLQEGTLAAEALARRLAVPVAVLSNFPDVPGYGTGWDELVQADLERLIEAWTSSSSR